MLRFFVYQTIILSVLRCTLLSSSQVTFCTRHDLQTSNCSPRAILTLSVDGDEGATEEIAVMQSATDKNGVVHDMKDPLKIVVTKSAPFVRYPVYYVRGFNAKPSERAVYTTLFDRCKAGDDVSHPTCGYRVKENGDRVQGSSGFCCDCNACQVFGFCGPDSGRGDTRCSIFGYVGAATCMVYDDLWYAGYSIGPAETWYKITIKLTQGDHSADDLLLGPERLTAASPAPFDVMARLDGDFAPFKQPHDFESMMLFVPASPAGHPIVDAPGTGEWMILDKSLVTISGDECNKVGIADVGFNAQGARCHQAPGSCLRNQLTGLRADDQSRLKNGKTPEYLVSRYGTFVKWSDTGVRSDTHPYVAYLVSNVQGSVVTLDFSAGNITFTVNLASGIIVQAHVDDFEANSKDGCLDVTIKSTALLPAEFELRVLNCTPGIDPTQAEIQTLDPDETETLDIPIRASLSDGIPKASCDVILLDIRDTTLSRVTVYFTVDAVNQTDGGQGGNSTDDSDDSRKGGNDKCNDCGWFNLICFLLHICWKHFFRLGAFVFAIVIAIILLIRFLPVIFICFLKCLCPKRKPKYSSKKYSSSPSSANHKKKLSWL